MTDTNPAPVDTSAVSEPPWPTRLRIAQRGWRGFQAATSLDDVQLGIGAFWVEIDGHRITNSLVSVEVVADREGFTTPRVTLEVAAGIEWVYLDRDGNELGTVTVQAEDVPPGVLDAKAATDRVGPPRHIERIIAWRDHYRAEAERLDALLADVSPVHACPVGESPVTGCCGRTPFDLPRMDRMTLDPALVTCTGTGS